jgi:hypothetical protein
MIKIDQIEVAGWRPALRGMRNPKDSWSRADSVITNDPVTGFQVCEMGPNDLNLAKNLHMGGPVHSKYKRYLIITMDISAPLYWWKEFDTYKVGTVADSCSTMHKIEAYPFTTDMFSHEHLDKENMKVLNMTIDLLNNDRLAYLAAKNDDRFTEEQKKEMWWQLIQSLPSTFNQKRTVQLNYEVATNIYRWRHNHKQDEWRTLCSVFLTLPYAHDIILPPEFIEKEESENV